MGYERAWFPDVNMLSKDRFSITATCTSGERAARNAAVQPAGPAPTTTNWGMLREVVADSGLFTGLCDVRNTNFHPPAKTTPYTCLYHAADALYSFGYAGACRLEVGWSGYCVAR